jgi:hypothetical protein
MSDQSSFSAALGDVERARADLLAAIARGDARAIDALRVRYEALEHRWRADTRARIEAVRRAAPAPLGPKHLDAALYPIPPMVPATDVGVCLSGGGSRAASAAMGELRGLRHLGLLDRVSTLSTVSGGTWAGVTFTYLPSAIADDDFLGGVVPDPGDLTWMHTSGGDPARALDVLDDHALGSLCTRIGLVEFLAKAVELFADYRDSPHVLWTRAVGSLVLEPFGLGDTVARGLPARYFSETHQWLDTAILPMNPTLSAVDFHLVQRPGRPHLVTNSTLFWPSGVHPRRPASSSPVLEPYPLEASPTAVGVPIPLAHGSGIGGGFVDPFAFAGPAPTAPAQGNRVNVASPAQRFALSDITGASSSAFVGPLIEAFGTAHPWLEDIDPVFSYWPITAASPTSARPYFIGDGGNLENTGIMALLRRRITRIVAFVHAEQALSWDPVARQVTVDGQLPPLFGIEPKVPGQRYQPYPSPPAPVPSAAAPFRYNQVFPPEAFYNLIDQLWSASRAGGSAMYLSRGLPVQDNAHFGVSGVGPVDVLWVYTNPVRAWSARLRDIVKLGMDFEPLLYKSFPNYDTVLQLHLEPRQVNLLAHLSCWNVINAEPIGGFPSNAELIMEMFGQTARR